MTKKKIILLAIIIFFIEMLFNIDNISYMIGNYKEEKININNLKLNGFKKNGSSFLATENNPNIEINNINKDVANIYFDISIINSSNDLKEKIDYTDEMFSTYNRYNNNEFTKYNKKLTNCHFYGKLKDLKITLNVEKDNIIYINKIIINKTNNVSIDVLRMMILFVLSLFLLHICFNKFDNYYDNKNKKQRKVINLILFIIIACIISIFVMSKIIHNSDLESVNVTYSRSYTDSIINGHFYLNEKPPKEFNNNPKIYDYSYRGAKGLWDTVYFKGKYYVYFGILPQLLLFVPFKLITGKYLSLGLVTILFKILSIIMLSKFYKEIINKFFLKIPFSIYILGLLFLIVSSRIIEGFWIYNVYQMISLSAFYFAIQGLYFILKFDRTNKNKYLLISTISLALSVSCRPPSLFISILIIPIILKKIKEKRFKKFNVVSLILPYLIVGVSLMIFNYIRFGNILEFGFKYQLTIADYTKLTRSYFNILLGIFYYLFAPLNVVTYYPYFVSMYVNKFPGYIFSENIKYSIMSTIIPLVLFTIPFIKDKLRKNKELWITIRYMLILGLFLIIFETLFAGITFRYMIDFAFLFNIPSILISLFIYSNIKEKRYQLIFIKILSICIVLSMILQILLIFN